MSNVLRMFKSGAAPQQTRKSKWPGRHPEPGRSWLGYIVGVRGAGKSFRGAEVLNGWPGLCLAIDPVTPVPPSPSYIAHYADFWAPSVAAALPELPRGATDDERLAELQRRGYDLIVVDEADRFLPRSRKPDPLLADLVTRGRHRGVSLLLLTQRPALLDYTAWTQCGFLVCFQLTALEDRRRVSQLHPDLAEVADLLPYLQPGQSVEWDIRLGVTPTRDELLRELHSRGVKLPAALAPAGKSPADGKRQLRLPE